VNGWDKFGLSGSSGSGSAPTFTARMVAKSYIATLDTQSHPINNQWYIIYNASQALAEALYGLNENPTSEDKDQEYRLYTRMDFRFCCDGNKIKFSDSEVGSSSNDLGYWTDMEGGPEIGVLSGTIKLDKINFTKKGDSSYEFEWRGSGRPNHLGEPSFQAIRPRTSKNIWHKVVGEIYCEDDGKGYIKHTALSGSSFPSHRLWTMGVPKETIAQGDLAGLWVPDPTDPTFVK